MIELSKTERHEVYKKAYLDFKNRTSAIGSKGICQFIKPHTDITMYYELFDLCTELKEMSPVDCTVYTDWYEDIHASEADSIRDIIMIFLIEMTRS